MRSIRRCYSPTTTARRDASAMTGTSAEIPPYCGGPSVVSPYESNALRNQLHADFSRIVVGEPTPARVDARLPYRR